MGLPIAVGGKTLSSRPIAKPSPVEEDALDGTPLVPRVIEDCGPRLAMAISPDQRLSVTFSLSYYDMIRHPTEQRDLTVADVRVQVSCLGEPYSSSQRDVLHRIPLPKSQMECPTGQPLSLLRPSAVFASDGRHVACLIPYPDSPESIVVVFQLRRPRAVSNALQRPPPPRPSYLNGLSPSSFSALSPPMIPVATNPLIVKSNHGILQNASTLCDAHAENSSILLVGCVDGSILVVAYRPAQVAGVLYSPHSNNADVLVSMSHTVVTYDPADGSRGRLVVVERGGTAVVFDSHLILEHRNDDSNPTDTPNNGSSNDERMAFHSHPSQDSNLMVHLEPLVDLEGPFVCAEWITGCLLAMLVKPNHRTTAEVWAILDDRPAEPLANLTMTTERLEEYAHGSFPMDALPEQTALDDVAPFQEATSIHYDLESGCLAISSLVLLQNHNDSSESSHAARAFCCVWHWRTNVVGLILASRSESAIIERDGHFVSHVSMLSRLYFSQNKEGLKRLVHVRADGKVSGTVDHWIRKEMYDTALLSPTETIGGIGPGCHQEASLLLSSKSVSFPVVSHPSLREDSEIMWKESRIPALYSSEYGPALVASIGRKRCRSVAVAASRGLCVLDGSRMNSTTQCQYEAHVLTTANGDSGKNRIHSAKSRIITFPKWRLFGSQTEERCFRVLAMTWWEGDGDRGQGLDDSRTDDLLFAVIQLEADSTPNQGQSFLACWSRRRLDRSHQLLQSTTADPSESSSRGWGIPLPENLSPWSISLLADPSSCLPSINSHNVAPFVSLKRKAVLLISSENTSLDGPSYHLFQAQVVSCDSSNGETGDQGYMVRGHLSSEGSFPIATKSNGEINTGLFLASASFHFDLLGAMRSNPTDFLATVGIVRSPGYGTAAVIITPSGIVAETQIIPTLDQTEGDISSSEVASYWQSNTICTGSADATDRRDVERYFVWSIKLCNGLLVCWSVPYFTDHNIKIDPTKVKDRIDPIFSLNSNGRKQFFAPVFAYATNDNKDPVQAIFGTVVSVGDSSTWMQEASTVNRAEFSLGCVPNSSYGSMLRCAQSARHIHRDAPGGFESSSMSDAFLDHEVFCLGECVMTPPAFISSLFSSLLAAATARSDHSKAKLDYDKSSNLQQPNYALVEKAVFSALESRVTDDTRMAAFRILILRIVELLARESDRASSAASDCDSYLLAISLFAEVVDAVKYSTTRMQFASLFLGIGRQIEPSCIAHLFPLPLATNTYQNGSQRHAVGDNAIDGASNIRSVDDLFSASILEGSLSVPSSALPLFSSKLASSSRCIQLLKHCLCKFEANTASSEAIQFDATAEERRLIHDLFHFGLKLEDAGFAWEPLGIGSSTEASCTGTEADSSSTTSSSIDDISPLIQPGREIRNGLICKLFTPSMFMGGFQKAKEEDAIHEAASSFISSAFEVDDYALVVSRHIAKANEIEHNQATRSVAYEGQLERSVAGSVAEFLLKLAFAQSDINSYCRWKKIRALAEIILGDEQLSSDDSSTKVARLKKVSGALSPGDFRAFSEMQPTIPPSPERDSNDDRRTALVHLLTAKIMECDYEIGCQGAALCFDLIIMVLARQEYCDDLEVSLAGLVVLGVVLGHVAGMFNAPLESEFGFIAGCYSRTLDDLVNSL